MRSGWLRLKWPTNDLGGPAAAVRFDFRGINAKFGLLVGRCAIIRQRFRGAMDYDSRPFGRKSYFSHSGRFLTRGTRLGLAVVKQIVLRGL
jgi:hypothetical protein